MEPSLSKIIYTCVHIKGDIYMHAITLHKCKLIKPCMPIVSCCLQAALLFSHL